MNRFLAAWNQSSSLTATPVDLKGKLCIVTGGNSGIGLSTIKHLAQWGAKVVMACRSVEKGNEAVESIKGQVPEADIEVMKLDLSDLASIHQFSAAFHSKFEHQPLHILINNAGIADIPYQLSPQGYEMHFATNTLGPFALTHLLLDKLVQAAPGRVVNVTGDIYAWTAYDCTSDYHYGRLWGTATHAYGRSKLGNIWFAFELAKRYQENNQLIVTVVHPGVVSTNLFKGFDAVKRRLFITPDVGCQTSLHCATSDQIEWRILPQCLGVDATQAHGHCIGQGQERHLLEVV